jgi:C4-dicarboxylate transporter DctM subunit
MDTNVALLLFGGFAVMMACNLPIAVSLGFSCVLVIWAVDLAPLQILPQQLFSATDSWTLLAVPFFILAGNLLAKTAISERLVRLASVVVGQFPAGLGMVAIIVSIFFAGISGSGPADTAALGAILIPAMVKAGYNKNFTSALMAAGGGIGIIIPPSIALLIYGVVANASISKLFIAGILPGILIGLSLFVVVYLKCGKDPNIRPEKRGSLRDIAIALKDAVWGLLAPVIILGGIYGGIFTATEAAVVAVIYGVLVGFFIHRDLKWRDLPEILIDSGMTSGVVMILVCTVCSTPDAPAPPTMGSHPESDRPLVINAMPADATISTLSRRSFCRWSRRRPPRPLRLIMTVTAIGDHPLVGNLLWRVVRIPKDFRAVLLLSAPTVALLIISFWPICRLVDLP